MRTVAAVLLILTASACASGPKVITDHDPSANFSSYRTYQWANVAVPQGVNPFLYQRVRDAIDRELQGRSYTISDSPDFAVGITLGARDRVEASNFGVYGSYYSGYGRPRGFGWSAMYSPTQIETVTEGTLAVDIYDAKTKHPVWHGHASERITSGDVSDKQIDRIVDAVMSRFPPGASE